MADDLLETKKDKIITPKFDFMEKWKLEQKCFDDAIMIDNDGKEFTWPRIKPTSQISYEQNFLDKVVDPDSGHYYPKRDKNGLPVKTPDNPRYVVNTIYRIKRKDNTEYLYSKGNLISYDGLGDEVKQYVSIPEKWLKTNFVYEKDWDPKRKTIVKKCVGPGASEDVYTLEFNEANLKSLFDKRENDYIGWIVKEEQNATPKQVSPEPNINDTFKLFLKPFNVLYNADYISPELKAQYRQEAIDAGLLTVSPSTTVAETTSTQTRVRTGAYT
jgi:hypothetical protein